MNHPHRWWRRALLVAAVCLAVFGGWSVADAGGDGANPQGAPQAPSAGGVRAIAAASKAENYTGIKPCRVLDTRASTPLVDQARNFKVTGSLTSQGGLANCGIPANATTLVMNLTGISTGSTGFVRAWAYGTAQPTATALNFGPAINVSNQINVPLCKASCNGVAFTLRAWGSTHLVGDAVGYYTPPLYVAVSSTGTIYRAVSSGVVSTSRGGTGSFDVSFDRDLTGCSASATDIVWSSNRDVSPEITSGTGGGVHIEIRDKSDALVDSYFYLSITC